MPRKGWIRFAAEAGMSRFRQPPHILSPVPRGSRPRRRYRPLVPTASLSRRDCDNRFIDLPALLAPCKAGPRRRTVYDSRLLTRRFPKYYASKRVSPASLNNHATVTWSPEYRATAQYSRVQREYAHHFRRWLSPLTSSAHPRVNIGPNRTTSVEC